MRRVRIAMFMLCTAVVAMPPASAGDTGRDLYRASIPGRQACAGCHGRDGQGGREGAVTAPAIGWDVLSREKDYNEARLATALAGGISADGRRLSGMPRYALSSNEVAALARYLARLPQDDSGGVSGEQIVLAAISFGPQDPWPSMLLAAIERHSHGAAVFGRRIAVITVPAAKSDTLSGADIFVAAGLPEVFPADGSEVLAQRGIPSLLPRGFLLGSETPGDALGWLPSLSQIVSAAERLTECGGHPPLIVASDPATAMRLNRALGTMGDGPKGDGSGACRVALGFRGDTAMPFAALQVAGTVRHYYPALPGVGHAALPALAEIASRSIIDALKASGPAPTRTRFLAEVARTLPKRNHAPVFQE